MAPASIERVASFWITELPGKNHGPADADSTVSLVMRVSIGWCAPVSCQTVNSRRSISRCSVSKACTRRWFNPGCSSKAAAFHLASQADQFAAVPLIVIKRVAMASALPSSAICAVADTRCPCLTGRLVARVNLCGICDRINSRRSATNWFRRSISVSFVSPPIICSTRADV